MVASSLISTTKPPSDLTVSAAITKVVRSGKKSAASLVKEIFKLQFGPGKITPQEYFYFRLFDDETYSWEQKKKFVGKAAQHKIISSFGSPEYWWTAHDKLIFYGFMQGLGFPTARILAIHDQVRTFGAVPALKTKEDLADFLRTRMEYPFFSKPVTGLYSAGAASISRYDQHNDSLVSTTGEAISVEDFTDILGGLDEPSYLFQEFTHPHENILEICGDRLATVRMVLLMTDQGPEIFRCLWKIPAGNNIADNYWRHGNMLADIDPETGRVIRVVRGYGLDFDQPEIHPDSHKPLLGFEIPDWQKLKDLCFSASRTLPSLRMQAWDVSSSREGPILVELNVGGDFNLPQIATSNGILDERFTDFINDYSIKQKKLKKIAVKSPWQA